jgi:replicative DNA helicase
MVTDEYQAGRIPSPSAPSYLRAPVARNDHAEWMVMGYAIVNPKSFAVLSSIVCAQDFADPFHGLAWEAIAKLQARGALSVMQLRVELGGVSQEQGRDVVAWLQGVIDESVTTRAGVEAAARAIRSCAVERRAQTFCEEFYQELCADPGNGEGHESRTRGAALVARFDQRWKEIPGEQSAEFLGASPIAQRVREATTQAVRVTSTGLPRLDAVLGGGLYGGKVYGFAGRMKGGKTMLLGTIAYNVGFGITDQERHVRAQSSAKAAYFSLEMGADENMQRLLARKMNINGELFRTEDRLEAWFQSRLEIAVKDFERSSLIFCDAPRMTLSDLEMKIGIAAMSKGIAGAFVDYQQLVTGKPPRASMAEHMDNVAQMLAEQAKAFGIWIVVAAQLNRTGEVRGSDGLLAACDALIAIHKVDPAFNGAPARAWLEMLASRYTPSRDVGSADHPAYEYDNDVGPHLRELEEGDMRGNIPPPTGPRQQQQPIYSKAGSN